MMRPGRKSIIYSVLNNFEAFLINEKSRTFISVGILFSFLIKFKMNIFQFILCLFLMGFDVESFLPNYFI
jgi:hypothetical protein